MEVNGTLFAHLNTVVFGWLTRLRDRVLIADEKLDRFHPGYDDLVKFFYGGIRQPLEYMFDKLRAAEVLVRQQKRSTGKDAEERIWKWPSMGVENAGHRDQVLCCYVRQEGRSKRDIDAGLKAQGGEIPDAYRATISLLFLGRGDVNA